MTASVSTANNRYRTRLNLGVASLVLSVAMSLGAAPTAISAEADADSADAATEEVVVVGNRRSTQVLDSASLVDLLSRKEIETGGGVVLQQSLHRLSPSFNFPQGQAARVGGGSTRSASLRGQNPDLTLVLVNGKRRHGSVATGGTFPFGGAGYADVNTIPVAAISKVEVLLDGASAQYGSDAIAGVLNIALREDSEGGAITTTLGEYKEGDGATRAVSGWWGTKLGNDGFLNVSLDWSSRDATDRSGPDIRRRYFRIASDGSPLPATSNAGTADPREPFGRDRVGQWGNGAIDHYSVLLNAGYNLTDSVKAYGWLNYASTDTTAWVNPQVPASDSNIRAIFPDGFQVRGEYYDKNHSALGGIKYDSAVGQFDFAIGYGRNQRDTHNFNLVAPSYGLNSRTDLYSGQIRAEQINLTADYDRDFDVSWLAKPLAFQAGAAYRYEKWWVSKIGGEQSWNHGGVAILDGPNAGNPAGWGGTEQGIAPWDVTKGDRDVYSLYAGADFWLSDKFQIGATVRTENYSDFGWTTTGKASARYDFTPAFALRGTYSTGYHAPSVGQLAYQNSGYTGTWGHAYEVGQAPAPNRSRQVRPDDPVAKALGGGALDPETSKNLSAGFVWRPAPNASLTIDAYQIEVDDRIVATQALTGPVVEAATAAAGIADYKSITFLVNGLDSRTRGVDVLGRYGLDFGSKGSLDLSLGYSRFDTKITRVRENTATSVQLFQRHIVLNAELGTPEYKVVVGADWRSGNWDVNLNQLFYGKYTYVHPTNAANDEVYDAKGYTNLEVSYNFEGGTRLSVGGNNIFDSYPAQFIVANQVNGINRYSFIHPEGANGAYYYVRLGHRF
ncbi:TonB-dependent receptor plug domain-containing protein [Asticcacaulis tiandongensis]|uniref:TonB-dependent receptor plug domain-containing protein n=1 Tax=Asticcacaulis tiandongensis TaxID=2565365 RepID=UPI0015E83146|nr:TonB-dependent receptor [Asticcacaulis tiandongensis]